MTTLSQRYLILFGAIHYLAHILPLIGAYETIAEAPSILPVWWWHLILLLVYGMLPVIYACIGGEYTRIAVVVTCTAGILVEMFKIFTWTWDIYTLYLILSLMDFFAVAAALHIDKF